MSSLILLLVWIFRHLILVCFGVRIIESEFNLGLSKFGGFECGDGGITCFREKFICRAPVDIRTKKIGQN
jgi:hypothetical protein